MNEQEALAKARQLKSEGWTVMAWDDTEAAMLGYIAFKQEGEGDEEVQWPMFGAKLTPDAQVGSAEELWDFMQANTDLHLCDNAKKILMGVVVYDPQAGVSHIRRITLNSLKSAAQEIKDGIMKVRRDLYAAAEAERAKRIQAIA